MMNAYSHEDHSLMKSHSNKSGKGYGDKMKGSSHKMKKSGNLKKKAAKGKGFGY